MKIQSFVSSAHVLENSARVYISETIKREGEITLHHDELVVPCYNHRSGEMFNLIVRTIKKDSVVGRDTEWDDEIEVSDTDWADGTALYIADEVAYTFGELSNF